MPNLKRKVTETVFTDEFFPRPIVNLKRFLDSILHKGFIPSTQGLTKGMSCWFPVHEAFQSEKCFRI